MAGASGSSLKRRVELILTAPFSSPLPPAKKVLLTAVGVFALATPVAAGMLASPAGQQAAMQLQAKPQQPARPTERLQALTAARKVKALQEQAAQEAHG